MNTPASSPRFAFFGTPNFAATILQGLLDHGWQPVLVVTESAKPSGRGLSRQSSVVSQTAAKAGLQIATPERAREIADLIRPLNLDFVVVAAYGKLIPASALAIPTHGFVNVHASLLPKYRGASPIQAAILGGEKETGISYMVMEPTLDTGPVIEQVEVPILPTDTTSSLTEKLAGAAARTIVPVLVSYPSHQSYPSQDDSQATHASKLTKADGAVRLSDADPIDLDRAVRALNPWPGVYTDEFTKRLLIRGGRLHGGTYVITSLQWEGKRPVDGATFARGYPDVLTALPLQVRLAAN